MSDNNPLEWCDKHKILDECGEPVASPQATRPLCPTCGSDNPKFCVGFCPDHFHDGYEPLTNGVVIERDAAQPAAGTTPFGESRTSLREKAHEPTSEFDRNCIPDLSEGTTPQAERPDDTVRFRERLKKISFLITGNDYAFLSENPEIEESLKVYVENVTEARAVAPVETANFVQLLPGGMCFVHGRYEGYQCPQWPKCITDPQKQEYLAQAQTLNATTFGDAGEG